MAAPSSLTEATTPSTASAPRVDPSAATFAMGRAKDEGQNAKQQLKILCDKFSASLTVAAVTDDVPRGSYAFECVDLRRQLELLLPCKREKTLSKRPAENDSK